MIASILIFRWWMVAVAFPIALVWQIWAYKELLKRYEQTPPRKKH